MLILGISAYYHDSAASIINDGKVIAAAQEERFTRKKHDHEFPLNAIKYCLKESKAKLSDIKYITFYDKPLIKFERLLETYLTYAPKGIASFVMAMPIWMKEKLFLKSVLKKELSKLFEVKTNELPPILFSEHHLSHAASAFYPSPFKEAAVLCLDGVGEWATTTLWIGKDNHLDLKWEIKFPHSLGLLYSAFTYFTGFKVNSGEYKLMGLAPYGAPKYYDLILKNLIDLKPDGTFRLNMKYFDFAVGLTMTNKKFVQLFGGPPRKAEEEITQREMDIAASIQKVTEEVILRLGKTIFRETKQKYLCLAGGVALNCVANGRLLREGPFEDIWIQPAAGDSGGSLGSAYATWYMHLKNTRLAGPKDQIQGSYLGPSFEKNEIEVSLKDLKANFQILNEAELYDQVATAISNGAIVGWFQGRMEFGPRALGARSILGDPRNPQMQTTMNLKIKYRESFRPFAPAILESEVNNYFELDRPGPYMLLVARVKEKHQIPMNEQQNNLFGIEKLKIPRSTIPAVTHIDYSARIQTVNEETNSKFYRLLSEFNKKTGCPILVNTSFNVRGEPIVCTPTDAYRCFMRTEMDYLVIENFLLTKKDQPTWNEKKNWKQEFQLD